MEGGVRAFSQGCQYFAKKIKFLSEVQFALRAFSTFSGILLEFFHK